MRFASLAWIGCFVLVCARGASAQDALIPCSDEHNAAQKHLQKHELLEARKVLRACSAPSCHPFVQKDCSKWLDEVQARIPSVVVIATSGGVAIVDATVRIDGGANPIPLDGKSVEVDPGEHTFEVLAPDGRSVNVHRPVVEGQINQRVEVEIPVAETKIVPPPPGPSESTGGAKRKWAWGLGIGGAVLAGTALGVYLWNDSQYRKWRSEQDALDATWASGRHPADLDARQSANDSLIDSVHRWDRVSLGLGIAGGAMLVVSSVLFLTSESSTGRPASAVAIGPNGARWIFAW